MSRRQFLDNGHFTLDKLAHFKLSFKETFDGSEYTDIPQLQQFKKTWEDSDESSDRQWMSIVPRLYTCSLCFHGSP